MLALERRNTLQRMSDFEEGNKINRMSSPTELPFTQRFSTAQAQASNADPSSFSKPTRATTMPVLPLSRLQTDSSSTGPARDPSAERIGVFLISEGEKELEHDSDESSICHSPAWDDAQTKKRRKAKQELKDKRKKEKEKAAKEATKEAKKVDNPKKRLVKPQPANKLSKMVILADRSNSAPVVPLRSEEAIWKDLNQRTKAQGVNKSTDTSYNTFMQATKEIPGHWNGPQPGSFVRIPTSRTSDGFIGGLKLRIADEAMSQETADRTSRSLRDGNLVETSLHGDSRFQKNQNSSQIVTTTIEAGGRSNIPSNSSRPVPTRRTVSESTPIMDRTVKLENRGTIISDYSTPVAEVFSEADSKPRDRSQRGVSSGSGSSRPKSDNSETTPKAPRKSRASGTSTERPPISYREPPAIAAETRGRQRSGSYVGNERQRSHDYSIIGLEDERKVSSATASIKSHSRGRSWSISSLTCRIRKSSSNTRPMTGESEKGNGLDDENNYHDFVMGNFSSSQPVPNQDPVVPPKEKVSAPGRRASILSPIKSASKGVFSKYQQYSHTPGAHTKHFFSSPDPAPEPKQKLGTRASNLSVSSQSGSSKADQILGASVNSLHNIAETQAKLSRPPTSTFNILSNYANHETDQRPPSPPYAQEEARIQQESPSRSTIDSCEDFPDETMASTPAVSRPQSQKNLSRDIYPREHVAGAQLHAFDHLLVGPNMSGATLLDDDAASTHAGWSRTAIPLNLDDDEERSKTPVASKNSMPNFSLLQKFKDDQKHDKKKNQPDAPRCSLNKADTGNGHQQKPTLSNPNSIPDSAHLSFLPELKHQALERPEKRKDKNSAPKTLQSSSKGKEIPPRSRFRPPLPSPPSSASPPLTPLPGQYLRTARLGLPPSNTNTKKTRYSSLSAPTPIAQIDPIAKMFVVCCSCRYFHDMPSKIYECMAKPDNVVEDQELGVRGVVSTNVRCPWCGHGMSTACCEGYAGVVYLRERLH